MSNKTMNKLNAEAYLMQEILAAIDTASKAGMTEEDIKTVLNRIVEVIESEE